MFPFPTLYPPSQLSLKMVRLAWKTGAIEDVGKEQKEGEGDVLIDVFKFKLKLEQT